eukprot:GGOE01047498.1.p1 GENE.GGOE01047498.1~~GGOE01047498.1.p1  ORF type:complete len:367 (-),score=107.03 GGOE01047498.1:1239-2312(-)
MPDTVTAVPEQPCLAVVAPEAIETIRCVTGTVVKCQKKPGSHHAQLQDMTVINTAEGRHIRIVGHIADGAWASVYYAREEETGLSCALKVIPIKGVNVDSAHTNLEMLKRLPHSNILQCDGHFAININDVSCLCIQLEFCGGGTLARHLRALANRKSDLSADCILDFASQMTSALVYIHSQGFLHGDFRSENVLMTADGQQLKLASFGSPLRLDCRGQSSWTITGGCKAYAPPEWMDSQVPHRTLRPWETPLPSYDMWSLGCVLSELVTLKLIRHDRRHVYTALAADPSGLQDITQEVAAAHNGLFSPLLGRLLEEDPDARITAPDALQTLCSLSPQTKSCLWATLCRPLHCFQSAS